MTEHETLAVLPLNETQLLRMRRQHRINLIWEITQGIIAISVTGTALYVSGVLALRTSNDLAHLGLVSNAFFLVIGFYFGRTNHARPAGVRRRDLAGDE